MSTWIHQTAVNTRVYTDQKAVHINNHYTLCVMQYFDQVYTNLHIEVDIILMKTWQLRFDNRGGGGKVVEYGGGPWLFRWAERGHSFFDELKGGGN